MINDLTTALSIARTNLMVHPQHRLSLADRVIIWRALGPRELNGYKAVIGPGLRRRMALARLCAKRVLPLWEDALPEDRSPHWLLATARQLMAGTVDWNLAWDRMNEFWALIEFFMYRDEPPPWVVYAGMAAANTLSVSLYDELFTANVIETDQKADRSEDFYEWDAALVASLAYTRENQEETAISDQLRLEFWLWYLDEAVPEAWKAAG